MEICNGDEKEEMGIWKQGEKQFKIRKLVERL